MLQFFDFFGSQTGYLLLLRGRKKSVSAVIPIPVSLVQYRHVRVSSLNPGSFCLEI